MARRKRDTNKGSQVVDKVSGLAPPFPAHPTRPTRFAVYCKQPASAPAGQSRTLIMTFYADYAAKKFIEEVLQGAAFKWLPANTKLGYTIPNTLVTEDDVEIRIPHNDDLERLIEHEYSPQEAEWELPEQIVKQVVVFKRAFSDAELVEAVAGERPPKAKREPKPEKPKIDRTGKVSVGEIAEQMGIDPRDARASLRKQKLEKPAGGWMWAQDQVDEIKAIIKKGLK